jgi:hypothetical protein
MNVAAGTLYLSILYTTSFRPPHPIFPARTQAEPSTRPDTVAALGTRQSGLEFCQLQRLCKRTQERTSRHSLYTNQPLLGFLLNLVSDRGGRQLVDACGDEQ